MIQKLIASSQSSHAHADPGASPRRAMPSKIEDYAIIGDTKLSPWSTSPDPSTGESAPRIDSGAASRRARRRGNGRWLIAPKGEVTKVTRHYEPETLILETTFETSTGSVSVCDFMPPNDGHSMIHRIVEGRSGTSRCEMELIVRYDYGDDHALGHRDR